MIVVVDASVALKWFVRFSPQEEDAAAALAIFEQVVRGELKLVQPPHFVAEVAAVLARLKPVDAAADVRDLLMIEHTTLASPALYNQALQLALRHQHHLFDTLYHAVALQTSGATLITADKRYFDKAKPAGRIAWLAHWTGNI
jgi:predicted nucleic acid-binding protein